MSYDAFLTVINQLAGKKRARCVIQGSVIFVESQPKSKRWMLTTEVFNARSYLPRSVRDCLSSLDSLKWQSRGANLLFDSSSGTIQLVQDILETGKYIPFRFMMSDFAEVASEWREILEEFAAKDHTSIRL
jgi:hypothetical protein